MKRYSTCREQSSRLSSRAQTFGYVPHSGAEQHWADAKAHEVKVRRFWRSLASDGALSQANKEAYSQPQLTSSDKEFYCLSATP